MGSNTKIREEVGRTPWTDSLSLEARDLDDLRMLNEKRAKTRH